MVVRKLINFKLWLIVIPLLNNPEHLHSPCTFYSPRQENKKEK